MFKIINDILSFLLELAMLAAFAFFGFHWGTNSVWHYVLGLGIPILVIAFWAKWMAPKSKTRLPFPWVQIVTLILFEASAVGLYVSEKHHWAIAFAIIALINVGLKLVFKSKLN